MIAGILNYVQSFFVLFLLIKILLFLIPRSAFEKYISFFAGTILVLGVLHPILLLFDWDESWHKSLYTATFEKQAMEASINVAKLSDSNAIFYDQQMKILVEAEIRNQMELLGIEVKNVDVNLTEDYRVNNMKIVVLEESEEGNTRLLEYLQKEYQLSVAQYEIVYE